MGIALDVMLGLEVAVNLDAFIYAIGLIVTITATFGVVGFLVFYGLALFVNKLGWSLYDKLCSYYGMQKVKMHFQNRKYLTFVFKQKHDDET